MKLTPLEEPAAVGSKYSRRLWRSVLPPKIEAHTGGLTEIRSEAIAVLVLLIGRGGFRFFVGFGFVFRFFFVAFGHEWGF